MNKLKKIWAFFSKKEIEGKTTVFSFLPRKVISYQYDFIAIKLKWAFFQRVEVVNLDITGNKTYFSLDCTFDN